MVIKRSDRKAKPRHFRETLRRLSRILFVKAFLYCLSSAKASQAVRSREIERRLMNLIRELLILNLRTIVRHSRHCDIYRPKKTRSGTEANSCTGLANSTCVQHKIDFTINCFVQDRAGPTKSKDISILSHNPRSTLNSRHRVYSVAHLVLFKLPRNS